MKVNLRTKKRMWEWRLQFVFIAQTRANLNLWTHCQRILVNMKWNTLLLLVASAAASVEREEPYLGSYQVQAECWVLLLPVTILSNVMLWRDDQLQWTIGCLLGRKLIGWFPPPPPYNMCIRGRSPKPKPWIYSSLAGGDSHQHLKFSYLLFLYLRCEQELFISPPENVSGIFGH